MPHLTCVGHSRGELEGIADHIHGQGYRNIMTLRGDPPKGQGGFTPNPDGFANSIELIEALAATGNFNLRVGAYPEPHPEAADNLADVRWLKRKFQAGAHSAITQFFFEADTFFRFRDACAKAGITAPITPGILPIENWAGARKFALRCGTSVPAWLDEAFEKATRDGRQDLLATALCTELCSALIDGGVENLHFYTLNRPELTRDVCHALGVMPKVQLENVA
jgi:methylenetetrahydrofolate reductase (NADPH)